MEPRSPSTRVARSYWPGRLSHQERAGEVDPDHPVPFGSVKQMDRAAAGNAGRVDDPVEAVGHGGQHSGDRASSVTSAVTNVYRGPRSGGEARSAPAAST
jgi:hypothetical protein